MDFFNSLSQVAKNRKNLKQWEKNQKDEQARREELYKRRQYSDEEIAKAKALGDNIIDVVDIMDNHSESVAENVETATEPIVAFAPFASILGSGWLVGKFVHNPNQKNIDKIREELINDEKAKDLCNRIFDFNEKNAKHSYFSEWDLTDKNRIKRIKSSELRAEAMKFYNKFQKDTAKFRNAQKWGWIGAGVLTLASFIGANIYAAKLQIDSSKIARYQARESLKDPKAFVNYTPEQIAKAKEEIAKHPELLKQKKKEKLNTGFFKSIVNILKDRKAYKKSIKNDTDDSKIVTRELTPDEIKQAKQDQEVIQRTVRLINNEAEKYSQNMEVAAEVLINGTPFLGAAVGGAIAWVLNKTGVITKFVDNNVAKNGSEKTKELYAELKKGGESGATYSFKWNKFRESFMKDLRGQEENTGTKLAKASKHKSGDIIKSAKRWVTTALAHNKGRGWLIAGAGSIVTSIAGMMIGLKLTKSASRAGRYTAKRELEKDPRNFIGYTEEDYNEVKDVKSQKKGISKVKEIAMFLPTVMKQYFAYEKYRKNEYKEKQVLNEQLHKQEVTAEQLREAKNLQRKLFNTFEKVDDNSQTYSESMEAAIDIAQPFVTYGGILASISPLIWIGVQVKRGKLSAAKVLNKITTFFSKSSERLKSKWFKKYLKNVANNVAPTVQKTNVESKPIGKILKGVDLQKDSIYTIFAKTVNNLKAATGDLRKMSEQEQFNAIWKLRESVVSTVRSKDKDLAIKIGKLFDGLLGCTDNPNVRADALDILVNPSSIKAMGKERYDKAYEFLKRAIQNGVDGNKVENFYAGIQNMLKDAEPQKIRGLYAELRTLSPEAEQALKPETVENLIKSLENIKGEEDKGMIEYAVDKTMSHENVVKVLEAISAAKAKLKAVPNLVNENPKAKEMLDMLNSMVEIPLSPKQISSLNKLGITPPETLNPETILAIFKQQTAKAKGLKIKEAFDMLPEKMRDPKHALNSFKSRLEKMTDDDFALIMEDMHFSSMNRKTALEIIPKLEKILNNIPKEEMTAIWDKVVQEFSAHPDEFIKLVKSGKVGQIFMTPGLKTALSTAGISFTAFTLIMTYAIESWLADIKLKAGRLGVMKAMEGLSDPRYYANIEPVTKEISSNAKSIQSKEELEQEVQIPSMGNLLKNFKNNPKKAS